MAWAVWRVAWTVTVVEGSRQWAVTVACWCSLCMVQNDGVVRNDCCPAAMREWTVDSEWSEWTHRWSTERNTLAVPHC